MTIKLKRVVYIRLLLVVYYTMTFIILLVTLIQSFVLEYSWIRDFTILDKFLVQFRYVSL